MHAQRRVGLIFSCVASFLLLFEQAALAEKKAFVVGINNYKGLVPLNNSAFSAEAITRKLIAYGYKVTWLKTEKQTELKNFYVEWAAFLSTLRTSDEVVFYFSGHGLSVDGTNYLVPVDADFDAVNAAGANLPKLLLPLPRLIQDVQKKNIGATVWILDACRNNPLRIGHRINLAQKVPTGHLFMYAAGDDQEALDFIPADPKGKILPSLYTRVLLNAIEQFPKIDIGNVLPEINAMVADLARPHPQNPYAINSLAVNWCFASCEANQLQKLKYETADSVNAARTSNQLLAQKSFLSRQVTQNAIYLGKKSRLQDCDARGNDTHPFGCLVLRDVSSGNAKKYLNKRITAQTDTNIRLHAPLVIDKKTSRWSCPVRTLAQGEDIELNGVLELTYAGDTFYWGTVGGDLSSCKQKIASSR